MSTCVVESLFWSLGVNVVGWFGMFTTTERTTKTLLRRASCLNR